MARLRFSSFSPDRHPTLARLLAAGTVRQEGRSYVGTAADGVVVDVGTIDDADQCERYLAANPTPERW